MKLSNRQHLCFSVFILLSVALNAQEIRQFSLEEAKEIAIENNKLLQIQQESVKESQYKVTTASAKGKPQLYASGSYLHFFKENDFVIPEGGVGDILGLPIPWNDYTLYQGRQDIFTAGVLGYQPVTQLFQVNNGVKAARAQVETNRHKTEKIRLKIRTGIEKLFYAVKIQERKIAENKAKVTLAETEVHDAESAVLAGKADQVKLMGAKANLADKKHALLKAKIKKQNYLADFRTNLSLPDSVVVQLDSLELTPKLLKDKTYYDNLSKQNNPELLAAQKQVEKAEYGVSAAKNAYIPDLGIVAGVNYQGIIDELPGTNYFVGANLTWNFFDFGKRKSALQQRQSQKKQATLYAENKAEHLQDSIAKVYRKAEQAAQLMSTAQEAYKFRKEEYRIKTNGRETGLISKKEALKSKVDLETAAQRAFSAVLNYNMAVLDLEILTGKDVE